MHFFELLNFQHVMLYLFPALIFIVLFALLLGYSHFRRPDTEARLHKIIERFPTGIEGRNAPFPIGLILIFGGALIWGILYTVFIGLWGIKI
jgi:hypothetical protein